MPQTVPNRPTNGPAEATVARNRRFEFEPLDLARDRDVEHLVDARVQAAKRGGRRSGTSASTRASPRRTAPPRRNCRLLRQRGVKLLERLAGPERSARTLHLARGIWRNSSVLSTMMVQHQNEAASRPSMTILTTICADQNIDSSVVSGSAATAVAASVAFMAEGTSSRREGRRSVSSPAAGGLRRKWAETWACATDLRRWRRACRRRLWRSRLSLKPGFRPASGGRPAPEPLVSAV